MALLDVRKARSNPQRLTKHLSKLEKMQSVLSPHAELIEDNRIWGIR